MKSPKKKVDHTCLLYVYIFTFYTSNILWHLTKVSFKKVQALGNKKIEIKSMEILDCKQAFIEKQEKSLNDNTWCL